MSIGLILLALAAAPSTKALEEGVRRFEAKDHAGALTALTGALDEEKGLRRRARVHLYLGLIQANYGMKKDARASFCKALDLNARIRLPKRGVSKSARALFRKVENRRPKSGAAPNEPKKRRRRSARKTKAPPSDQPVIDPVQKAPASLKIETPPPEVDDQRQPTETADARAAAASINNLKSGPLPPAPPPAPAITPTSPKTSNTGRSNLTPAWITLGVGAAGLISGAVFSGLAISNQNASQDPNGFASDNLALHETAKDQRTIAIASGAAGAVICGLAAVLFALD